MLHGCIPLLVDGRPKPSIGRVKRDAPSEAVGRKRLERRGIASRRRKTGVALVEGGEGLGQANVVLVAGYDVRRVDDGHVVDAVTFHVGRDAISRTEHSVGQPLGLPCYAETWLEVVDSRVGVVVRAYFRRAAERIEIHVVAVIGISPRSSQFVAKSDV